jgi:hypothetical protein
MVVGGLATGSARGGVVALAGLAPLLAGALDLVLLGPLFGQSIRGTDIRKALGEPEQVQLFRTHYEQLPMHKRMLLH